MTKCKHLDDTIKRPHSLKIPVPASAKTLRCVLTNAWVEAVQSGTHGGFSVSNSITVQPRLQMSQAGVRELIYVRVGHGMTFVYLARTSVTCIASGAIQ